MRRFLAVALCAFLLSLTNLVAAPYDEMDYGPFLSHTFQLPNGNVTLRGIAVPFDAPIPGEKAPPPPEPVKGKKGGKPAAFDPTKCGVLFDTELLRYSGYWNGGFVTWTGVVFNGAHGANPGIAGKLLSTTNVTAGWANAADKLVDPRSYPHGPMPREVGRYKGLYRTDKGVIFSYTVGESNVLDMPSVEVIGDQRVFTRVLNLSPSKSDRFMLVADLPNAKTMVNAGQMMLMHDGEKVVGVNVTGGPKGTKLHPGVRMIVQIPASNEPVQIRVGVWSGAKDDWNAGGQALDKLAQPVDLAPLTKGGKARFTETATTQGKLGDGKTAYTVDSLTPPFKNPYKSWMRFGGLDFFSDGKAAISTWSGDVWIVSGIDDKLEKLTWKRYAAGLFHALGLKIVDDKVYVLGRDQITRLHDTNGDGEADFYECFNNDAMITTNFHEFTFDLQTDPEGNFYFIKGGPVRPGGRGWDKITPHHGCIFKVSSDGSKLEVVARGFRAPNGMGVGPNGEITTGDNEGTWTPTCPINWIKQGGFYGVPDFVPSKTKPTVRENPLCWMPHNEVDNSNGGQVWITGKNFGPLSGQLLHTSYGKCKMYNVLKEEVAGQMQGGVVPIPIMLDAKGNPKYDFDSGVSRLRFNEKANALFITGLRGWQTTAQKDAGFYRVRYTGAKANLPVDLKVKPGEVSITFSDPLDKASAADADNFNVEQWNYRWTENYGSAQYKVSDAKKQGHDAVEVDDALLSADGKTVTLKIAKLAPVMQMKIQYSLKAADGSAIRSSIHNTINVVGERRGEVHVGEYRIVETKK
jgi:glucose/arabinose dehydrogenase